MIRFTAQLQRFQGDPCWLSTVENLYRQRLAGWLDEHGYACILDSDQFTVDDSAWTVLALWQPVPELELVRE
jgi:hypothetical protein